VRQGLVRAVAIGLVAVCVTACALLDHDTSSPQTSPQTADPVDPLTVDAARQGLHDLPLAPRSAAGPAYDRKAFGSAWADIDDNGCNQRDDVLLRDVVAGTARVAQQGRCDHDVLAGTWIDPYTGHTLTFDDLKAPAQAQAIQIDHVVPLAEAWRSGASAWSDSRRRSYANDLSVLLAVDGRANAAKSDDDPAAWRPRKAYQCEYAVRWITVKAAWSLAADRSEVAALREMLGYCAD
jgi:hypothetical protein